MRLILALPGNEAFAGRLAEAAGGELGQLETRRFPDGEHYVRLLSDPKGRAVDLVCSLHQADASLLPLLFAADAARELGAVEVNLIAPYLGYMRQDARFQAGEAVSSKTFARLISSGFDRLVTVDPHLHRYADLAEIYSIPCTTLHAAAAIGGWIRREVAEPLVIGPDAESEQWAQEIAAHAGAPRRVLRKDRRGDRDVQVHLPDLAEFQGRQPVLVDDIASSGRTLVAAAEGLAAQGFRPPLCVVVHALFAGDAYERLAQVAERIVSTDTVPHPSNGIGLAPLVAHNLQTPAIP